MRSLVFLYQMKINYLLETDHRWSFLYLLQLLIFFLLAFLFQFYKAPIITTSIAWNLASREILLLIGWPNIYNICRCYEPLSLLGGFLLLDGSAHIFLWQSRARSPSLLLTLTRILLRSPFHPFHSLLPSRILSPFSSLVAEPLHSW